MKCARLISLTALAAFALPHAAVAQIYFKAPNYSGLPVLGLEPGFDQPMPGATAKETDAALIWNLRSALNIAALQCQFEPTLRTVENYNALIVHHKAELDASYASLNGYYLRLKKTVKAGQAALDTFGTRTISAYSTVRGQLGFCETAGRVGRDSLFTPKGGFLKLANERLRELRNSLKPAGEQMFGSVILMRMTRTRLPDLDPKCWSDKGYDARCGWVYGGG
jgi:hypothetical protein